MIRNARIVSTQLFDRERGLSFWINLEYGDGMHQSAGGVGLGDPRFGVKWLAHICEVVGAVVWEDLAGRHCRVRIEEAEFGPVVVSIGNVLEDEWHDFGKGFDA